MRITVEGNIASGKSTILRFLGQLPPFKIVQEPLSKWQKLDSPSPERELERRTTANLLETFYKDPARWAFAFQIFVLQSRLSQAIDEEVDDPEGQAQVAPKSARMPGNGMPLHAETFYIFERSIFTDKYCFAKNCFENNLFNDIEWHVYNSWFSFLVSSPFQLPPPSPAMAPLGMTQQKQEVMKKQSRPKEDDLPKCVIPKEKLMYDGLIYLRTSPETCHFRLRKRNRSEEASVPLDYLTSLHARHEEWLLSSYNSQEIVDAIVTSDFSALPRVHFAETGQTIPILILDCNGDWSEPTPDQPHLSEQERRALWENKALERITWFLAHLGNQ